MADALFIELQRMKFCPLCRRKWHIIEENGRDGKAYFVCDWCQIICWIRDHFVGKWDQFEPVHCAACRNHQMRFFCREDGYCKWLCKNCGCVIEQADPDRHSGVTKTLEEIKADFKALTADPKTIVENDKEH